jgi:hypothetical protein
VVREGDSSATSSDIKQQVTLIALAGLLHDIGKFAQRAEADPETYRTLSTSTSSRSPTSGVKFHTTTPLTPGSSLKSISPG